MKSALRPPGLLPFVLVLVGQLVGAAGVTEGLAVDASPAWATSLIESAIGAQAGTPARWLDASAATAPQHDAATAPQDAAASTTQEAAASAPPDTALAAQPAPVSPEALAAGGARLQPGYGQLPMRFEPNRGQTDASVQFLARGPGYQLFLTPEEAVLVLRQTQPAHNLPLFRTQPLAHQMKQPAAASASDTQAATESATQPPPAVIRMRLEGLARNATPTLAGTDRLPGHSNYFTGQDPTQWRTGVQHYAKVRYAEVYPGIDLVYYGNPRQLEYDFVLAPGADPGLIQLAFTGAERLEIDAAGNLLLTVTGGTLVQQAPRIWQEIDGERRPVAGRYVLRQPDGERLAFQPEGQETPTLVGFQIAHYQPNLPLVIDPVVLSYATFLGGSGDDGGLAIAVDAAGQAYITGATYSPDFPVPAGPTYTNHARWDVFVAKLNAAGNALEYTTFLGGQYDDFGQGIAVDSAGNAYVIGSTDSNDFPVTPGAIDTSYGGGWDVFVAKLNAAGSAVEYATYLGGQPNDNGQGIAVDSAGHAYVTGSTGSLDFPVTAGAIDTSHGGGWDVFVAKLNAAGSALEYATYFGGQSSDSGSGIAVDSAGNAYVIGSTDSNDFPVTAGAAFTSLAGVYDAFVAKLNVTGTALDYASYLGGDQDDEGRGIAVDGAGQAYVTGLTSSGDFPVTQGAAYPSYAGGRDAFIAKLNPSGTALDYATYLGGQYEDLALGIAVDARGLAYVTGITSSNDFPVRYAPYPNLPGLGDAFLAVLAPDGGGLVYGSYLGGSGYDQGFGIALDSAGNAYITGSSDSSDFPTTASGFDTSYNYGVDAFIAKFVVDGKLLLVSRSGGGSGLVSSTKPDGTIDCGQTCSAIHPVNTAVRLLASTQPVSTFAGWGGDCAAAGTSLTCNLTLATDRTVSASFVPLTDDQAMSQVLDLDLALPGIDWYQPGNAPWFAQNRVTHDGVDAAQSGAIGDNQSSELEVTLTGPAYLSFWWKVSSEKNWDYLRFYLDDVQKGAITGETDWTPFFIYVPAGGHTLTWAYEKDENDGAGQDAGWLDHVVFDNADRTLVIDTPVGGTITGAVGGGYPLGTALSLVATPASGYYFGGWGGDCQTAGMASDCQLVMDLDKRVSAVFIQNLEGGATAVTAGSGHSCAVADGGVRCWGDNGSGQLGNGTTRASLIPVQAIPPGSGATAVAAGSYHSCAVVAGGVQCWGLGESGQLGNGGWSSSPTPVWAIPAGTGATAIAAGYYHSCAVVAGGVQCWGANGAGQLGNGGTNSSPTPVWAIPAGKGAMAVAAGSYHSCAVIDGGVRCWGRGWEGQLGNGSTNSSYTPVQAIPAGSVASAIAAGSYHSCAVVAGGVKCWGGGWAGELGNGGTNSSPTPVQAIPAGSGANAVAAGSSHSCAVVAGGVQCWGFGWYGQLGNGGTNSSPTPVQAIPAGSESSAVAAGERHSCALVAGGVQCWGGNDLGQLGNGTQTASAVPVWTQGLAQRLYVDILTLQVQGAGRVSSTPPGNDCTANCTYRYPAPTTVILVATPGGLSRFDGWGGDCTATTGTSCALSVAGSKTAIARFAALSDAMTRSLDLEGAVWTGGGDAPWFAQDQVTHDGVDAAQSGAIGDKQSSEVSTTLNGPGYLSFWWKVSSEAPWDLLSFYLDGELKGSITGEIDWSPVTLFMPTGAHTLAWVYEKDESSTGGEDAGWLDQLVFDNANRTLVIDPQTGGSIGGSAAGAYTPGTVLTLTATAASNHYFAGWSGDCAGAGQAASCELTMETDKRVSASFLPLLQGSATDVAAGGGHSCAVADGGVRCWGDNGSGQLGNGTTAASLIPVQALPSGSGATAAAGGKSHSCAVVAGGVQCWGSGESGQLGNGSYASSFTPVWAIPVASGATAVAAGESHSCAVVAGGVLCWGEGSDGQLGNGSYYSSSTPVWAILAGSEASAVGAGATHSCAVVAGGVKCWGEGSDGQLGNGSNTSSPVPVKAIPAGSGASAVAAAGANEWFSRRSHSCAVVAGGVKCWGSGGSGQLGNGSYDSRNTPVQAIPPGSGASAIATGGGFHSNNYYGIDFHSCAVVAGGVKCWGYGGYGQLGNGGTNSSSTPVQTIPAGSGASAVAVGLAHSCAIIEGGIQCWGGNDLGQLGVGTQNDSTVPIWTQGLTKRVYVDILNLRVQGAGRVTSTPPGSDCTGNCTYRYPAPTRVTLSATAGGLSRFDGWEGDCAGTTGATCQLDVALTKTVTARFAPLSDAMTRSLDLAGAVWTQGGAASWFGQEPVTHDGTAAARSGAIGDNQTSTLATTLTGPGYLSFWWKVSSERNWDYLRYYLDGVEQAAITGEVDWSQVTRFIPAGTHTLTWAYEKDGNDVEGEDAGWLDQVVFDQANRSLVIEPPTGGSIGGGSTGSYPPGTVLTLTAAADGDHYFTGWGGDCLGAGQAATCALTLDSNKLVSAIFLPLLPGAATDVAAGSGHGCAVADGGVRCWGDNGSGQLGNGTTRASLIPVQAIQAGSGVSAVAAGASHTCAVVDGGVQCWGAGYSGQLGNGGTNSSAIPVQAIPAGSGATAVAAGDSHSCAVVAGGVKCWGASWAGQLGNGSTSYSPTPVQAIPAGKGVTAVAAGSNHSCAVVAGGVKCWGYGNSGQLGNGGTNSSPTPVQAIPAGSGATDVAASGSGPFNEGYSCAVVSDGVQCWGYGGSGLLGNGGTSSSAIPVQAIPAGTGASAVAAGYDHSCAVVAGGVQCWGNGYSGQLGNGGTSSSATPVQAIPAGSNASAVAAGYYHSCALVAGGVQCWGSNSSGQLGDGTQDRTSRPQPVLGLAADLGPGIPVTATAGPGGSISPIVINVPSGEFTTFILRPDPGYSIAGVSGCNGGLSGTSYTTGAITQPCTVSATFSQNIYAISAMADPVAGGTVTCAPNSVTHGGSSLCTAEIANGYGFVNWGGHCSGTALTCTLTNITAPREVRANLVDLGATLSVTHSAPGYQAGGLLRVNARLNDTSGTSPLSLLWRPRLPAGWTLTSVSGAGTPELSQDGKEILFTGSLASMPIDFSYQVAVPANAQGLQVIGASVEYQNGAMRSAGIANPVTLMAAPNPLTLDGILYHSADYRDARWLIDGSEVNRVLAYWRAGAYHADAAGDDGYAPGGGSSNRNRHSADYQAPFWRIDGSETNRVLAYWRAAAYHADPAGADGFAPGVKPAGAQAASITGTSAAVAVSAGHSAPSYVPGGTLTVTNRIERPEGATLLSLLWRPSLPAGWTIKSVTSGDSPELSPDGTEILFLGSLTANPLEFTYQVAVPAGAQGQYALSAQFEYMTLDSTYQQSASVAPNPLDLSPQTYTVSATAGAGGTASCNPATVGFNGGSTCTATPTSGFTFGAWSGACGGQGATCTLASIQGNQSSTASFTATNATTVTVVASDATATEAGLTTGTFTFTRTGSTAAALTVNYKVSGTATAGSDYTSLGTSVSFAAKTSTVTKTVTPLQDTLVEPDETIILTLAAGTGYSVGSPSSATLTLTSDEIGVSVVASDASASEAGLDPGTFTFTRTGNTAPALTVNYTVSGTATSGSDYKSLGTSVSFAAGASTVTKTVTPVNDTLIEANETVILTLKTGTGYSLGSPSSATVTLISDDVAPTVTVVASDDTATEAGLTTGIFTFTRTGSTSATLTVSYTVTGTATAGSDYTSLGTSVSFAAGSSTATKTVKPLQDTLKESNETVILTLKSGTAYTLGTPASATVTLTSDE